MNKKLKRYVKNFNDRIFIDDFVLNMKDSFRFYANTSNRHQNDEKKQVYQRDVRNTKRKLMFNQQQQSRSQYIDQQYTDQQYQQKFICQQFYQSQYIDQQQQLQSQYIDQQYTDQQYQQKFICQQFYQSQYIDQQQQQQRFSFNNNQLNREFKFQFFRVQESSRQQQNQSYSTSIFDQKLLINQTNHVYFISKQQYDQSYQNDSIYENAKNESMKSNNNVNNDIKYSILNHVNFDDVI